MKLSAPIFRLKRDAKRLSRRESIPLHAALDTIARNEGYNSWSLLAAKHAERSPAGRVFARLAPGDLLLLAARPGQGKTLLALQLGAEAVKAGGRAVVFSLEYTRRDVLDRLGGIDGDRVLSSDRLEIDCSDDINAGYIMAKLAEAPQGTLAVVDYLQLLDRKRQDPPLGEQVRALGDFARTRGHIIVFVSQIDRSFDPVLRPYPGIGDIRLPNPVDLELFGKRCFLHEGELHFEAAGEAASAA